MSGYKTPTIIRGMTVFIALLFASTVFFITSVHGIGISPDSFAYLRGAELLLSDPLSPSEDLSKFPPLYGAVLALLQRDLNLILWFNAGVLVVNVLLLAGLMQAAGVRPRLWLAVLVAVAVAPEVVFRHAMVMSEPLFLVLVQLTLLLLVRGHWRWAAVVAAAAPMQRYAGLAVIAAGAVYVLWRYGWRRAFLFGGLAVLPVAGWLVRGSVVGESARQLVWHPISGEHIVQALITLGGRYWFAPAVAVLLVAYWGRRRAGLGSAWPDVPPVVVLCGLFIAFYGAFLVASISLFDFFTPLDSRILSPVLFTGWVIAAWLAEVLIRGRWAHGAFYAVLIGFVMFGVVRLVQNQQAGVGLVRYIQPEYYPVLAALPPAATVYSNHTVIVDIMAMRDEGLTGLRARSLPARYNRMTQIQNPDYPAEVVGLRAAVATGEAVILWFEAIDRPNEMTTAELDDLPVRAYDGLRVYGVSG